MSRKAAEEQVQLLEQYIFGEIPPEDLDPAIKDIALKDFSLDPTLDKAARTRAAIVWALKQSRGGALMQLSKRTRRHPANFPLLLTHPSARTPNDQRRRWHDAR